jgi:hypothetical protein
MLQLVSNRVYLIFIDYGGNEIYIFDLWKLKVVKTLHTEKNIIGGCKELTKKEMLFITDKSVLLA